MSHREKASTSAKGSKPLFTLLISLFGRTQDYFPPSSGLTAMLLVLLQSLFDLFFFAYE